MTSFIDELFDNYILGVSVLAWFIAQTLKVVLTLLSERQFDITMFVGSGGMPSSHAAFVVSMATSIGRLYGYDSASFALSTAFALVVMYDAAGVRRAAGKQAAVLNDIIDMLQAKQGLSETKLKELIGHTPIEVFAGAGLGIFISRIFL